MGAGVSQRSVHLIFGVLELPPDSLGVSMIVHGIPSASRCTSRCQVCALTLTYELTCRSGCGTLSSRQKDRRMSAVPLRAGSQLRQRSATVAGDGAADAVGWRCCRTLRCETVSSVVNSPSCHETSYERKAHPLMAAILQP